MKKIKSVFALTLAIGIATIGTAQATYANVIGDVDGSGSITTNDADITLKYVLNNDSTQLTAQQLEAAKLMGDKYPTSTDAAAIMLKTYNDSYKAPVENVDTSDGVVVTTFSELKKAITGTNKKIYVKGKIECTEKLSLSKSNANISVIGLKNADGTAAILDFDYLQKQTSSWTTGITIGGSYYSFKDIIIENASDCGVRVTGSNAGHCTFENCVFRYNQNSGVSITQGGAYNTFISCDSYRNGDIVKKCGDDADGYSVKLSAGADNKFYNCRAWENSDDGWDSYDRDTPIGDVSYEECLAWNNGNPEVFTGEYDYKNGFPLDKKLLYIQAALAADSSFEEKYNKRTLDINNWPQYTITLPGNHTRTYAELHSSKWGGNPNGFKFGSATTPNTSYRYIKNCIAFDHHSNIHQLEAKGYDQNNGYAKYDLVNALSFNNVQNYWMDKMTALSIKGTVKGFNINQAEPIADAPSKNMTIITPSETEQKELADKVYAYRDMIYSYVYNDMIPGEKLCNVFERVD